MAQEVLHVQLSGRSPDRPGGKGVTETVRIDLGHTGLAPVAREHDVEVVVAQRPAVDGLEQGALSSSSETLQVVVQRSKGHVADRRPALLPPCTTFCSRLRPGLQPGQLPPAAGAAEDDSGLVTAQPAREADQDGGEDGAACQAHRLPDGRGSSVEAGVCCPAPAHRPSETGEWLRMVPSDLLQA